MNLLVRWGRFNLVGAMGAGVQLAVLAALHRSFPVHYLLATAGALEVTLVHNFVWHLRYTWRDRRSRTGAFAQYLRFHLSNGLVSYGGNLFLMALLVGCAHLPVLPADGIAILCCSMVNFCLGHNWVFAEAT